jgi:heat-inducible transcriptional repressor
MAILENLGYIEKNHISSGRIPSQKGYKYYVEFLMKPKDLNGEEMLKIQAIFNNKDLMVNDAISKSLEIISDLTNYTSVVLGKNSDDNKLKQVNVISLEGTKIVALVCTDKGSVLNKQYVLPEGTIVEEIVQVSEMINKMLVGTPINLVSERLEFEIKPILAKKINEYQTIYNIFYDAFNDFVSKNISVHVEGRNKLLNQPEYDNASDLRRIASKLEDDSIVQLVEDLEDGEINIYIGEESKFDDDVTIVRRKYKTNNEEGTIAIIGPKRMEYDRVTSLLDYVIKELEGK